MEVLNLVNTVISSTFCVIIENPILSTACFVIGVILLVRWYIKLTCGFCNCSSTMIGKTVIITGANSGIGKITALELAKRGARVILACRSPGKGLQAATEIINCTGNENVVFKQLDLCSFESVRKFAKDIIKTESNLKVLINNAGLSGIKNRTVTVDGCEKIMQSNYLGHFLLTNLLLDEMKKNAPSRIINVSSSLYHIGSLSWDDIQSLKEYLATKAYAKSKAANIMFTLELARRLEGTGVTANCLHPGMVKTEILQNREKIIWLLLRSMFTTFGKTPLEGAQTTLHLTLSKDLENVSGKYFTECKETRLSRAVLNRESAQQLWSISERIVGL